MGYKKNNRDKNEAEIIRFLRTCGCVVRQMDRHAGFDLLVLWRGNKEIVEIKNPEQSWTYTRGERDMMKLCEMQSVNYWTIETVEDAARMIGV